MGLTVSDASNLITACATLGTLLTALAGLRTWRKQIVGAHEYEVARMILLNAYKVREATRSVRNPFLSTGEAGRADEDDDTPWEVRAYSKRWNYLRDALVQFETSSLEAEVLWGKEFGANLAPLSECINKLRTAVDIYVLSKNDPAFREEFTEEYKWTLYLRSRDDEYSRSLDSALNIIEEALRPYLRQTRNTFIYNLKKLLVG